MLTKHSEESLKTFTASIVDAVTAGGVPGPVHLSGGNETQLLEIFKEVREQDWVCSNYRSHYHALLKGVPEALLKEEILAGRSINLQFPKFKLLTSAIVAGQVPIALGIAFEIKRQQREERVWCFVGDMARATGLFYECMKFAAWRDLPITFVVEDNRLSVCTPTREAWGEGPLKMKVRNYDYVLDFPHAGATKRTNF